MVTKRWYACKELYDTEKVYVDDLRYQCLSSLICRRIVTLFIDPMRDRQIISDEMEYILFGNIRAILSVHGRLLSELASFCFDANGKDRFESVCIGKLLLYYTPFMKLYLYVMENS